MHCFIKIHSLLTDDHSYQACDTHDAVARIEPTNPIYMIGITRGGLYHTFMLILNHSSFLTTRLLTSTPILPYKYTFLQLLLLSWYNCTIVLQLVLLVMAVRDVAH